MSGKNKEFVPLEGSEIPFMSEAKKKDETPTPPPVEASIYLRPTPSGPALPSLEEVTEKPFFQRKQISEQEFKKLYGADPADVDKVKAFARENGLVVVDVNPVMRCVQLSGTVKNMEAAFNIKISKYEYMNETFRGYEGPVFIPVKLEKIVTGVFGLTDKVVTGRHLPAQGITVKQLRALKKQESKKGKYTMAPFFSPSQLAQVYNFPTGKGVGQTIGIIELGGGYLPETISGYFDFLNYMEGRIGDDELLKPPTIHDVECGSRNNPGVDVMADLEVCADIEVAGAVANAAELVVYFGKEEPDDAGFLKTLCTAILDFKYNPSVISISWGSREEHFSKMFLDHMNWWLHVAGVVRNITVCVATGDTGSSDSPPLAPPQDGLPRVDFPASSPWALACGGTQLISHNGAIIKEVVWNDGEFLGATGGGFSNYFPGPPYQVPGYFPPQFNRGIPDVAANASFQSGYFVQGNKASPMFCGGTSAVAPLWASLIALLNQKLNTRLGFINPILYRIKNIEGTFNDIIEGNNQNVLVVPGYCAVPGWDACTGLGTPNGQKICTAIEELKQG